MIRHMVALRYRDDVSDDEKAALYADLGGLSGHIDGISDYQIRRNISSEAAVMHGFNDLFWFDFRDLDVRDTYLEDATHKAIGARLVAALDGGLDGITVFDFEI